MTKEKNWEKSLIIYLVLSLLELSFHHLGRDNLFNYSEKMTHVLLKSTY